MWDVGCGVCCLVPEFCIFSSRERAVAKLLQAELKLLHVLQGLDKLEDVSLPEAAGKQAKPSNKVYRAPR